MDNGQTQTQAAEVINAPGILVGWPNAFSALPVMKEVLAFARISTRIWLCARVRASLRLAERPGVEAGRGTMPCVSKLLGAHIRWPCAAPEKRCGRHRPHQRLTHFQ